MLKIKMSMFVIIIISMMGSSVFGEEISSNEILKKVEQAYASIETYKSSGTVVSNMDMNGLKVKTETSFNVFLKKPNLYLITWNQNGFGGVQQSGAVWNDGTQPYLYMNVLNGYSKMTDDETALAGATGISGGVAFTIPSLFLNVFKSQISYFSRLKNMKFEKFEKIGEENCFVLSGSSDVSKKEMFWISERDYFIRKYERSFEPPMDGLEPKKMTDEEIEDAIKSMGHKVTEESKKKMRKMMDDSQKMLKNSNIKGSSAEVHINVTSPELNKIDFKFDLPKNAEFKDSLFGGLLGM